MQLNEEQRSTITHGLRVAMERFEADAKQLRAPHDEPVSHHVADAHERLATQFDRQAEEARAMADLIDGAEFIELGPEVE